MRNPFQSPVVLCSMVKKNSTIDFLAKSDMTARSLLRNEIKSMNSIGSPPRYFGSLKQCLHYYLSFLVRSNGEARKVSCSYPALVPPLKNAVEGSRCTPQSAAWHLVFPGTKYKWTEYQKGIYFALLFLHWNEVSI